MIVNAGTFTGSVWEAPEGRGTNAVSADRGRSRSNEPPSAILAGESSEISIEPDLSIRLFNAAATLKALTSQVSMHLSNEWRRNLYQKIDLLYDPEEWDATDQLIGHGSFWTFLRMILERGPVGSPGLGVSARGHLIAGWKSNKDSITLEFFPSDQIRWFVVIHRDCGLEYGAGITSLSRINSILESYVTSDWYLNEKNAHEKAQG